MLENPSFLRMRMKPAALCRGQLYSIFAYFPTQGLNFAIKGRVKSMFSKSPGDSPLTKVSKNIVSGGIAGSLSLAFVYSLTQMQTLCALGIEDKRRWSFWPLHSGLAVSCFGIFAYRALYFGMYDTARPTLGESPS